MQPIFRVVVIRREERRVATADEADALCNELAELPVFTANTYPGQGIDPSLEIIVETGRAHVFTLDMVNRPETEKGLEALGRTVAG